ncbi:MAG: hypothetical protein MUF52_13320 [Syntrophobacteraceae bacterium]|jgi:hypothetical protein|nr:hypothetical protein [Syntrophobacteraceae bacterium]
MNRREMITDERGLAMVLVIPMIGLLSLIGIWLVLQSEAGFKTTSALERRESVFNLSEAASQLAYRCLLDAPPSPSYNQLMGISPVQREHTSGLPAYITAPAQPFRKGTIRPRVFYATYSTTPPPGWMLNKQGYLNYYGLFNKAMGDATIPLPATQSDSRSVVSSLTERVMR